MLAYLNGVSGPLQKVHSGESDWRAVRRVALRRVPPGRSACGRSHPARLPSLADHKGRGDGRLVLRSGVDASTCD